MQLTSMSSIFPKDGAYKDEWDIIPSLVDSFYRRYIYIYNSVNIYLG